jgi:hypothetical protein
MRTLQTNRINLCWKYPPRYLQVAQRFLRRFSVKTGYSVFLDNPRSFLDRESVKSWNSSLVVGKLSPSSPVEGVLLVSPPNVVSKAIFKSDSFCIRIFSSIDISSSSCCSLNRFSISSLLRLCQTILITISH